jgi:alkylation response protein AidB-like acyl-CoA dehydrogenase
MIIEEYHLLSTAAKVFITEESQETLSDCRAACGGLGYMKYAGFGVNLSFNDVNRTWEGDNYVLA